MSGIVGQNNIRGSGIIKKITTDAISDDAITLAKMASGTDGNIISYDASGNPAAIATGSDGQVLTSTGAGSPPAMESVSAGGDLSFGGDTFGANKVIGSNDAYTLSLETNGNTAMTIDTSGHITQPLQPAFVCTPSANSADISADTWYDIVGNTEIIDRNGDWDGTSTFTAPVTGLYVLSFVIAIYDYDVSNNGTVCMIYTSNRNYRCFSRNNGVYNVDTTWVIGGCSVCDMDSGDTAKFQVNNNQGVQQPWVGQEATFIGGYLLG